MRDLRWHQRMIDLAGDVVSQELEELKISPAAAAVMRQELRALQQLIQLPDLGPSELISLGDKTEIWLDFLASNSDSMSSSQREAAGEVRFALTGLPPLPLAAEQLEPQFTPGGS